ncbi:helix-hairpin-helix motif [Parafrankia sp. EAN1pec]|uniref:ComEA family DNA-binding protein n=1 Tax=Parafrankia sp. (strain EAN1pec) TaxID=298653 RepID=UPI00015D9F2B|nr:helix-hairpin-helix motif [Frankia sp. EAN1pec]
MTRSSSHLSRGDDRGDDWPLAGLDGGDPDGGDPDGWDQDGGAWDGGDWGDDGVRDEGRADTRGSRVRRAVAARLPPTLRDAVLAPTARAALVLVSVAVAAAAVAGWLTWRDRPVALQPSAAAVGDSGPGESARGPGGSATAAAELARNPAEPASGEAAPTAAPEVVVDVAGRVARPGVVRLPAGSRVVDAVERAGGVLPGTDTTGLALARVLTDGEQVLVDGRPGPAPPPPEAAGGGSSSGASAGSAGGSAVGSAGRPLNLNTATVEQLDALPGVGPVLAQRIIDWRAANGPFTSPDQLGEVSGVGDRRLADLLPLVTA